MQYSISAVIPLHNKETEIVNTIKSLNNYFLKNKIEFEIIIVENGSTDNSKKITLDFIKDLNYILFLETPKGLGKALKAGIHNSSKDIIWFVPADFLFQTSDIEYYLENRLYPQLGICSRTHRESDSKRSLNRKFISYIYYLIYKTVLKINLQDLQGAFIGESKNIKAITKLVKSDNFFFQTELISRYLNTNLDYSEIPVTLYESPTNKTTIKFFRDIIRFLKDLIVYKFS